MLHLQPPAGIPIQFRQLAKIIGLGFSKAPCAESFLARVRTDMAVRHCYLLSSGRAALVVGLRALAQVDPANRTEVIMPAYTCFTVAASIVRSGLTIRLVDIDPSTLDYDYGEFAKIDFARVLAIIGCNMFGILSDWPRLRQIAQDRQIYLIDDAAQSMGGRLAGQASGTLGDIGFYSLGRGKNMTAYGGGILLTDDDNLAKLIEGHVAGFKDSGVLAAAGIMAKLILYSLFLRPWLYWLPASLPFLGLGETEFEPEFDLSLLGTVQACAASVIYDHLAEFGKIRATNARKIATAIAGLDQYSIPGLKQDDLPNYLRLPVLMPNRLERDRAIIELKKIGIVASHMYPSTISRISGIGEYLVCNRVDYPGAQQVVDCLLALPIHPYMTDSDINKMVAYLRGKR